MSGHSHFASIKHKKALTDAKRGKTFSKFARHILIAAREKGGDPDSNPTLRMAVEKAREYNMPKDNIERAIKKGTGELAGERLEEVLFEAFGPAGVAIIIEGITDNKNRALGEIKQTLVQHNGKMAGEGSVRWLFDRKGCLTINPEEQASIKNKDDLELALIEAGAEDIYRHKDFLDAYTKPDELEKTKKNLEAKGIKVDSASLDWVAKEQVEADDKNKEICQKLFEALDENEAVQEIYSNLKE